MENGEELKTEVKCGWRFVSTLFCQVTNFLFSFCCCFQAACASAVRWRLLAKATRSSTILRMIGVLTLGSAVSRELVAAVSFEVLLFLEAALIATDANSR